MTIKINNDEDIQKESVDDLILMTLLDGEIRPLGEIAYIVGVNRKQVFSVINQQLANGIIEERQVRAGKTKYFSISRGHKINKLPVELKTTRSLKDKLRRPSNYDEKTCNARTCFGHFAGKFGVGLRLALIDAGFLVDKNEYCELTRKGKELFLSLGLPVDKKHQRAKNCLDGSERYYHIGGALGRALAVYFFENNWTKKRAGERSVIITDMGCKKLNKLFNFNIMGHI